MCLSLITTTVDEPNDKIVVGYKVFYLDYGKLLATHFPRMDELITTGKWLKAKKRDVRTKDRPMCLYQSGFHVYVTVEDAKAAIEDAIIFFPSKRKVIVPVLVKRIMYCGRQDGHRVIVAEKMFVPEYVGQVGYGV